MRACTLLPLAAGLASALVIPEASVFGGVDSHSQSRLDGLKNKFSHAVDSSRASFKQTFDHAFDETSSAFESLKSSAKEEYGVLEKDVKEASANRINQITDPSESLAILYEKSKKWYDDLEIAHSSCAHMDDEEGEHHGKRPHHPPHHHKPNLTVYQLIKKSKYTTKLAKLVDEFPEVVERLNGTESNFTFFAPTDRAFDKIPDHAPKPSKEFLLKVLGYHGVPGIYPAGRVLKSNTLPTYLWGDGLSDSPEKTPQRLTVKLSFRGVTINYLSRVIAINILGTNGIIHGIDELLVPLPKAATIVQAFPGAFSTLELGLWKTGLIHAINDTSNHLGGTLFAPSNRAWERLGPRANAFLFSKYGEKYLAALLKYHVVANTTLYSDAIYVAHKHHHHDKDSVDTERTFHIDLPTLLKGKSLSIDVARWTRLVDIRINGFNHVAVTDAAPARDGVIHVLTNVLVPPKTPGGEAEALDGEIEVEALKARLQPYIMQDESDESDYDELDMKPLVDQDAYEFSLEL